MLRRLLTSSLPVAAMVLMAGFATHAGAASIVSDGGFESVTAQCSSYYAGSLGDGWTVTQGNIQICTAADGNGVPHSGNQMAYLDEGYVPNTLSQTLTTVIGQSYLISF
jgi:hypothetical protein